MPCLSTLWPTIFSIQALCMGHLHFWQLELPFVADRSYSLNTHCQPPVQFQTAILPYPSVSPLPSWGSSTYPEYRVRSTFAVGWWRFHQGYRGSQAVPSAPGRFSRCYHLCTSRASCQPPATKRLSPLYQLRLSEFSSLRWYRGLPYSGFVLFLMPENPLALS